MTSPSPGQIARFLQNQYDAGEEAYLYVLTDLMKAQYDAIEDARFVLQLDCPDLARRRHAIFAHVPLEEFRQIIAMHVETLNDAVRDIRPDDIRMHICWAGTMGPHHTDVPLKDIGEIRFVEVRVWADY